ncbi:MAG TPA: UDP-glucuronic acid decarboxylase family protein [Planctomycetota bacterium]|nr:UDP-glucuronic acid decarboxylase family protein [Planctomycetota bacterium]
MKDKRVLVAGGAGFIGSHLCRRLVRDGAEVVCVDSLITGRAENVRDLVRGFSFLQRDVSDRLDLDGRFDVVFNLASPASPIDYASHPLETLRVCSAGTLNLLEFTRRTGAVSVLASTSEVYGDPEAHPQTEAYWGHVNPVGPRSPYDEGKRFSEAAAMAYDRLKLATVRIARIFNTYGPGMREGDGRMIPNFIGQALTGEPLTVYGDGSQTRSLCFVSDMVEGLIALSRAPSAGPYNIGNPDERTVLEVAKLVIELTKSKSRIEFRPLPQDDPRRRCPDISRAKQDLRWFPRVPLREGLATTIESFRK